MTKFLVSYDDATQALPPVVKAKLDTTYAPLSLTGTFAARPAATAVPNGMLYYPTDVSEHYRSNGSVWLTVGVAGGGSWINYTPTWFTSSQVGLADQNGRWVASGKTITYQFYVRAGAAGVTGTWAISLPVTARSIGILTSLGAATISVAGAYNVATTLLVTGGLKVSFILPGGSGSLATAPATNNEIFASLTYEAA